MEQEYKYMVCTRCMTFNHASYIVNAMNGFTMQETTFPVITLIVDDASTDGEQEVIKQYLADHFQTPYRKEETDDYHLICAIHNSNPNCIFVVFLLKYNHYSIKKSKLLYYSEWLDNAKYHALCEGDDYWINPRKLKIQVDVLETHPHYSMSCHNAIVWDVLNKEVHNFNKDLKEGVLSSEAIIGNWIVPTASMVYRSKELSAYPDWLVRIYSGDMALILRCMNVGPIFYFDELMSVYRKNSSKDSMSTKMTGREIFVLEQHNLLLESFDKGTNYRFHEIIIQKVRETNQIMSYAKKSALGRIFEPYFYKLIQKKIRKMIKA